MSKKAVQTVKQILKKADNNLLFVAIDYRNTSVTEMTYFSSQLLRNRIARTKIPFIYQKSCLCRQCQASKTITCPATETAETINYDKSTKPLPPLETGENVRLRQDNIWVRATVSGMVSAPYTVSTLQQTHSNPTHFI